MPSSSPSSENPPTKEGFLRAVLRSRLLDREQLKTALKGVAREQRDDPHALADHLVHSGHLSRFQASKLLKGSASGLVLGPYRLLAPIGKGGMGWVFLARDTRTDTLVALKLLPPARARTEERTLARFRREMELSQKVAHPHIAWTCEVGECQGVHYIAMEYIPGKTLSAIVNEEGPLELERAARLMAEVAAGLDHAHGRGLIHRDLKPSNIQVTPRDHAKILDLGLALILGESVSDHNIVGGQGIIVGTMDYIAPEQTTDALSVSPQTDLYSLGCTLYFSLAGKPPFPGGTSREKVHRHRGEEPTPLEQLRPGLPPGFLALVRSLMSKDPEQRPASARAVAEQLLAFAGGEVAPEPEPEPASNDEAILLESVASGEFSTVNLPQVLFSPELEEEASTAVGPDLPPPLPQAGQPPWVLAALLFLVICLGGLLLALVLYFLLRR